LGSHASQIRYFHAPAISSIDRGHHNASHPDQN
jgi:hypothetical protein